MTIWQQIAAAFADLRAAVRSEVIAGKIWMFLLRMHRPEDAGEEGTPHPYCLRCRTDWPCEEFNRISDARDKALS